MYNSKINNIHHSMNNSNSIFVNLYNNSHSLHSGIKVSDASIKCILKSLKWNVLIVAWKHWWRNDLMSVNTSVCLKQ